jgi:hypothetical protein
MLLGTTFVALLLVTWVDRARREREGVSWVLKQRGHITYDFEWPGADGSYPRNAIPRGPVWLRNLIGIEYFAAVTGVVLDWDEINDLAPLTNLRTLRFLGLMNYVNPQTDFAPLRSLKHLEHIRLDYTGLEVEQLRAIQAAVPGCRIESKTDPELNSGKSL